MRLFSHRPATCTIERHPRLEELLMTHDLDPSAGTADVFSYRCEESAVRRALEAGHVEAAVTAALRRFGPEVRRYLHRHLGRADLAEDAFSDFSERIWSSLPRFRWRCSIRTWAFVLARRTAADALRAEVRERARRGRLSDWRIEAIVEPTRSETPPLLRTEITTSVARLRDELAPRDKTLLVLRAERGLKWKQVARVLHEKDPPDGEALAREAARLRKRFQLLTERLRDRARGLRR
jgi:RNA polymerase sigma-70 factor (ECF subfamily)